MRDTARDIRGDQGIAPGIEPGRQSLGLREKRVFRQLPFDGVAERARQPVAVEVVREQVIVRASPDDLACDLAIIVRSDDEDGSGGSGSDQYLQCVEARAIGQL